MAETTYRLVIRRGPELNKVFELTAPLITLGRDIINDITISDPEMSRQHCQLARTDDGYMLEDLASTNGTFINGERLSNASRLLKNGDNIGFGETVLVTYTATSMPVLPGKAGSASASKGGAVSGAIKPDADTSQIQTIKAATASAKASAAPVADAPAPPAYVYAPPVPTPAPNPAANRMMLFGCGILTAFCLIGVLLGVIFIDASGSWGDVPVIGDAVASAPVRMETVENQYFRAQVPRDWQLGQLEIEDSISVVQATNGGTGANIGHIEADGFSITFTKSNESATPFLEIAQIHLSDNGLSTEVTEQEEDSIEVDGQEGQSYTLVNKDGDYVRIVSVEKDTNTLFFVGVSRAKDRQDNEKIFDYVLDHLRFE